MESNLVESAALGFSPKYEKAWQIPLPSLFVNRQGPPQYPFCFEIPFWRFIRESLGAGVAAAIVAGGSSVHPWLPCANPQNP